MPQGDRSSGKTPQRALRSLCGIYIQPKHDSAPSSKISAMIAYETLPPLAGLAEDNHGPWNRIVSLVLLFYSLIFYALRLILGRWKKSPLGMDDAIYALALVLAIAASITSERLVAVGLGQHMDTLSSDDVDIFFKTHYTTQFLAVLSMYCAKGSIVLMFHQIIPHEPRGLRYLLPVICACAAASLCLVAFQCQLPTPWMLKPASCSTSGRVHYATAALNMATDAMVAVWVVPAIWKLQMKKSDRQIVSLLLLARFLVVVLDLLRVRYMIRAFRSTDNTWHFLSWVMMDQVVVHFSLNHATLPRINYFLRNLGSGLAVARIRGNDATQNYGPYSHPMSDLDPGRRGLKARSKTISSSQEHLHLPQGTDTYTMVVAGDCDTTSSVGRSTSLGPGDIKVEQIVEIRHH
ncbi:hypothetical protein M011DRAFT_43160 [Sporormia fimetaria CBS 119925]|uniref:Rhodopsin domain-containing protein n=1 Tax=Sporormia fimetaria CBS 119925 TaxID=1340428 RepID=A0A6A6VFM8_9PLEO|nr:hypothetical protein M011DRAFT_43160 [Sporormia fimetaria CBS 119925]